MAVANKQEYIRLKWSEKDQKILVEGADEDRFSMTVEEAIEACKVYERAKKTIFRKQFDMLLDFLGAWSHTRKNKLAKVFLTIRDAGLLFLAVTKRKTYDANFEEELTQLDLEIANSEDFSEILLSVQSLPLCSQSNYDSFCYPERTLEYTKLNAK